jgi:hypothetical protein
MPRCGDGAAAATVLAGAVNDASTGCTDDTFAGQLVQTAVVVATPFAGTLTCPDVVEAKGASGCLQWCRLCCTDSVEADETPDLAVVWAVASTSTEVANDGVGEIVPRTTLSASMPLVNTFPAVLVYRCIVVAALTRRGSHTSTSAGAEVAWGISSLSPQP